MNNNYIASKLYGTEIYKVGPYILPKQIGNLKLKEIRGNYIYKGKYNPNVQEFLRFMEEEFPEINFIQELIIPTNKFVIQYRSLDFFIPNIGVAIELDSHYHDDTKESDKRTDLYLYKKYGIKTLRVRLASQTEKEIGLNKLRKLFKTTKFLDFPWPLDFSEQIAEEFKNKYKEEMMELEILEKQFADGLYSGDLILSKEQEIKLKPILKILDISYSIIP